MKAVIRRGDCSTLMLRCILSLACVVLLRSASAATTYCVATNGNDSNPGTEAAPWKTLRKASGSVRPGDTVRIKAGEYFVGPTWIVDRAGTAEQPITYQAFGDGEARITSSTVLPSREWKKVKGAIYSIGVNQPVMALFRDELPLHLPGDRAKIHSVDDLIPNSFYVTNKTVYAWLADDADPNQSVMRVAAGHVVSLYGCDHTILDGLTVEFGFNGIKNQRETTHHVTIRNCVIRSISSQGIQPVAKDCTIERNLFQKIGSNKYDHGIYGSQSGTIIRGNTFEEISGAGIHQFHQGDPPAGGNCEFSGNIFRKPRKMTVRSGPVTRSPYYVDIIAWGEGRNRIFNNVFLGEGKRSGISLNSVSNRVYNNIFESPATAVEFHTDKPGNEVVSNLFLDASGPYLSWPARSLPQTLNSNLYHNARSAPRWERDGKTYRVFNEYQTAAGETHSKYEKPPLSTRRAKAGAGNRPAAGPLRVCAANPRYFADPSGHAVYLTGSHTWQSLQDGALPGYTVVTQPFDYTAYLNLLQTNHHNFIRLWRWELTTHEPQPWSRTGPGEGRDGKLKFDLRQFNQAYFDRLRARVIEARERGIYVSIMLFEDWIFMNKRKAYPVEQHPFHKDNNITGINGDPNGDGNGIEIHTLQLPDALEIQKAYVRKVIETVNDLDNVLYEICNEGKRHTREWQYEMVRFIKSVETKMPKQHPVGMTSVGDMNEDCLKSPADWTSLATVNFDQAKDVWASAPPAATGQKVCLLDTDHIGWKIFSSNAALTRAWVWKSFARGHSTLLMENLADSPGWVAGREAMGQTRHFAERMDLASTRPEDRLASSGYCLAHAAATNAEYLVYLPNGGEVRVDLSAARGKLAVEWFELARGTSTRNGEVEGGTARTFKAPFDGEALLYLSGQKADSKE